MSNHKILTLDNLSLQEFDTETDLIPLLTPEDEEEMNPPPTLTHRAESDRVSLRRQLGRYGTKRHRSEEIWRCPGRRRYQARQSSRAHHQLRRVRQEVQERAGVRTTTGRTSSRVKHNAGARCLEVYDEVVKEMASGS